MMRRRQPCRTFRRPTTWARKIRASATTGNATTEHDPEQWEPVFGQDHAQKENLMADFLGMMKQAAQLQTKMQELQAELDRIEVEGAAGGGMVTVRLTAKGEMKGEKIDESRIKPGEPKILEDLLVAAHADARRKAEEVMQDKMKGLTGGLSLPPGLKLF